MLNPGATMDVDVVEDLGSLRDMRCAVETSEGFFVGDDVFGGIHGAGVPVFTSGIGNSIAHSHDVAVRDHYSNYRPGALNHE
ncbi:MAG: hypothetical protein KJN60_03030 [Boseongicola sp.]|nr:hypothetical protein [Boseongicola sp.]